MVLLVAGISNPALDRFLCNSMKLPDMQKLARSMDGSCVSIINLSLGSFEKVMEGLLFRVGELQGLAKWYDLIPFMFFLLIYSHK